MLNETFLNILKHAIRGEKAAGCEEITLEQWQRLFAMAGIHSVMPLFYEAVYDTPVLKDVNEPFVFLAKRQVVHQVMMQAMKTSEFLMLNKKMQEVGVKPLVVKGLVCRNLYPQPDHRPSGDEDILIPEEKFDVCHHVMQEFGMAALCEEEDMATIHEVSYGKPGSPLYIEMHKHLFPPTSEAYGYLNDFFVGVFDRAVAMEIQGQTVYTLDYTDNLFYMLCHALKHFLHSGFGIRQVCDIIMFAMHYGEHIEWNRIMRNCKAINAEYFAASLFKIGRKYLGFNPDKACWTEEWNNLDVDETDMLKDLLDGGIYGDSDMSRKHSSNITLDAVKSQYIGRKSKNSVTAALFPSRDSMEDKYPYLKKHPYLLPVAWISRIVKYAGERPMRKGNNAAASLKIGHDRVNLMKKYRIIKDGKRKK